MTRALFTSRSANPLALQAETRVVLASRVRDNELLIENVVLGMLFDVDDEDESLSMCSARALFTPVADNTTGATTNYLVIINA